MKTAIDLCCGIGGASLALQSLGYHVTNAVDNNPKALSQYKFNFPHIRANLCNAEEFEIPRNVDLIWVSPPCNKISVMTPVKDCKYDLLYNILRPCLEKSKIIIIETVPYCLMTDGWNRVYSLFDSFGYKINTITVNLNLFGIPQNRYRTFIFISRGVYSNWKIRLKPAQPVTVRDFIHDLAGEELCLFNKASRPLQPRTLRSMIIQQHIGLQAHYPQSMSRKRIDEILNNLATHKRYQKYYLAKADSQLHCIRSGNFKSVPPIPIHYLHYRTLTIRELARCHGYPDSFMFAEQITHAIGGIGNSVPPLAIYNMLYELIYKKGIDELQELLSDYTHDLSRYALIAKSIEDYKPV
jgi:DNA (cytosine-5)-methyltransferase 1